MADGGIAVDPADTGPLVSAPGLRRLIVSALPEEQAPLRQRWGVHGRGQELIEAHGMWFGVTGDGANQASRKLREFIRRAQPEHIVVVGLAGGLSETLPPGALIQGRWVQEAGRPDRVCPLHLWLEDRPETTGVMVSAPQLLGSAKEKAALWRDLGCPAGAVVDLESWTYAQVAQDAEVPMSILRVVSDASTEDLPHEVVASSRPDGSVRRHLVLVRALCNPRSWRPLGSLKRRLDMAARKLADAVQEGLTRAKPPR